MDTFERGLLAINQRNDDIAITCLFAAFDNDHVIGQDAGLDHGFALYLEYKTPGPHEKGRQVDFILIGDGFYRQAGCDTAKQWQGAGCFIGRWQADTAMATALQRTSCLFMSVPPFARGLGHACLLHAGDAEFRALVPPEAQAGRGDSVTLSYDPEDVMVFDAATEALIV